MPAAEPGRPLQALIVESTHRTGSGGSVLVPSSTLSIAASQDTVSTIMTVSMGAGHSRTDLISPPSPGRFQPIASLNTGQVLIVVLNLVEQKALVRL